MRQLAQITTIILFVAISSAGSTFAARLKEAHPRATLAPADSKTGNRLYVVLLRTDYVRALGDDGEVPAIAPSDMQVTDDDRAWHRPDTRKMVRNVENDYGIRAHSMTSWIAPGFSAYLSPEVVDKLEADPRIDTIEFETTTLAGTDFSAAPPWSENDALVEKVSYAKIAMDMNDALSTTNRVYMLDAGLDANGAAHDDLDSGHQTQAPMGTSCLTNNAWLHATAVAGVLSAEHNGMGVKGMNNAAPVTSVRKGCSGSTEARAALDWAVADAEANNWFAIANLSANDYIYADGTSVAQFIRKASSRLLIVQSAGNYEENACNRAYSVSNQAVVGDGILVVGAVDRDGKAVTAFDFTQIPGGVATTLGTSYGPCVEVWAPGQLVWVDWSDITQTAKYKWSGTSFAAPAVAALAARYGGASTNPVIREAFIRSKLFNTGYNDLGPSPQPLKVPSYTQTPAFTLPVKLTATLSVSSTYLTFTAAKATDSNYLTTAWNSGVTPNYPMGIQPYLQMDFGATKSLYSMRFMPAQTPSGTSTHEIWTSTNNPPTYTLARTITRDIMDGEMHTANLQGVSARFVKLVTRASPSWASYYEVEVFGN